MSDTETYMEYGVFVQHGSSEVLLKSFRKYDVLEQWRGILEDDLQQKITAIRTRHVSIQRGEWSEVPSDQPCLGDGVCTNPKCPVHGIKEVGE